MPTQAVTSESTWWWVVALCLEVATLRVLPLRSWILDVLIGLILLTAAATYFSSLRTGPSDKDTEEDKKREDLESRELSSPLYEAHRVEKWFELKKLEYEKAAERYDNIYRAIWQNFSYLAVLAGGILAFATKGVDWAAAYCLALTPLAFWYLATFLPMDHYGDETRRRLSIIEGEINQIFFPKPNDPKLRHFTLFRLSKYRWRVQDAVRCFGMIVFASWVQLGVFAVHHAVDAAKDRAPHSFPQALHLEPQPFHVEMRSPESAEVRDSLALLARRVSSTDSLLRCRLLPIGAPGRPACKR